MAEGKKSFILYSDIQHTVKKLTDEKAGQLFKHLLAYVNNEHPTTDDIVIEIAFEPIKQSLKRDLVKYEEIREKKRLAGIASAESKKQQKQHQSTPVNTIQQDTTDSTVNVNDSVSDINIYKYSEFYDSEIGTNQQSKEIKSYESCVMFLHGTNELKKPLSNWLKLENQITYIQYETLLKKSREKGRKISEMLLSGFNDPKHLKGKKSIYLTLNNWLNMTKK